ncbi:MAG: SO2930 family diheme c-type cytochrome [Terriglobales bacterium]
MPRRWTQSLSVLFLVAALAACGRFLDRGVQAHTERPFPTKLSKWRLFTLRSGVLTPNKGVVPYDLNTPLFSDYASKYRFVWMPPGTAAQYRDDAPFDFPIGTVLAKTFAFPVDGPPIEKEKLIETRLLVHAASGWTPLLYLWDAKQQDATLQLVPDPVPVKWTDAAGHRHEFNYVIPNANECHECHDNQKVLLPIGPKARNLNKEYAYAEGSENQLAHWARIGYLQGLPTPEARPRAAKWDDPATGSLADRAAAYLDNNCAHCHQPGGRAGYTGVDFRLTQNQLASRGLCKSPNSAGEVGALRYDLVPGRPDESILIYRLESTAPKTSMPALSRDVVHLEGVKLLREWIASLPGGCDDEQGGRKN